ncbi:MAG: hypothetical protein NWE83_06615 [Candidatus Bathyarchaeota archaeon]|nr:hypothetical protein [Candidatus Bathyarchaeota archaeon]
MGMGDEDFSKAHPVKIKDTDVFLHGTSSKKYLAIKTIGFLKRDTTATNWDISSNSIYFEKYDIHDTFARELIDMTIQKYCEATCRKDQSSEGVILQITGRDIKHLGCKVYADWNKPYDIIRDANGKAIDVDSNASVLSIIIIDKDIPLDYLTVFRRISFKD